MIRLPPHLFSQYRSFCADNGVNDDEFADHLKWLRYFLDFCEKYRITGDDAERTGLFLDKLQQKGKSEEKRQQARKAVSHYFDMIRGGVGRQPPIQHVLTEQHPDQRSEFTARTPSFVGATESFYNVADYQEKSDSPEWDEVMGRLADEIKVRHYSRKTLKTYALWSRQFQRFLKNKPPVELCTDDVKAYLTPFLRHPPAAGQLRHSHYPNKVRPLQPCPDKQDKCDNEVYSAEKRRNTSIALKTTMIYTHCVPVRTVKEARSPLDLD